MTKPKKTQRKKQKESDSIRITKTKDKENAEKPLKSTTRRLMLPALSSASGQINSKKMIAD